MCFKLANTSGLKMVFKNFKEKQTEINIQYYTNVVFTCIHASLPGVILVVYIFSSPVSFRYISA